MFIDFLADNYFWFLLITIFLFLALIGYIVDTKEQNRKGLFGDSGKNAEKNFEELAKAAAEEPNKTINMQLEQSQNSTNINEQSENAKEDSLLKSSDLSPQNVTNSNTIEPVNMMVDTPISNNGTFEILDK